MEQIERTETASAEEAGRLFCEAVERLAGQLIEALEPIVRSLIEAIRPAIEALANALRPLLDALTGSVIPRKWVHLSRHAKRARTRKKYAKKIRDRVAEYLARIERSK